MRHTTLITVVILAIVIIAGLTIGSYDIVTSQSIGGSTATPTLTPIAGGEIITILPAAITVTLDTNGGANLMVTDLGPDMSKEPESLPTTGFYCQHSFSDAARASCLAAAQWA